MKHETRPTPETDELEASLVKETRTRRYFRALDSARKLERERNEAIDAMRGIDELKNEDFPFGDFSDRAINAFLTLRKTLAAISKL